MDRPPQTWEWSSRAPVRADAEGVFVPCSELPDAAVGDTVVVTGHTADEERTGTIVATSEGDDETFFRLAFEAQ